MRIQRVEADKQRLADGQARKPAVATCVVPAADAGSAQAAAGRRRQKTAGTSRFGGPTMTILFAPGGQQVGVGAEAEVGPDLVVRVFQERCALAQHRDVAVIVLAHPVVIWNIVTKGSKRAEGCCTNESSAFETLEEMCRNNGAACPVRCTCWPVSQAWGPGSAWMPYPCRPACRWKSGSSAFLVSANCSRAGVKTRPAPPRDLKKTAWPPPWWTRQQTPRK